MDRGQEHAGKVGGKINANLYDLLLQGKIDYDFSSLRVGPSKTQLDDTLIIQYSVGPGIAHRT